VTRTTTVGAWFVLACGVLSVLACASTPMTDMPLLAVADFEGGSAIEWLPNPPDHWRVSSVDGTGVYELTAPGTPGEVRAPTAWSVLADHDVASFALEGRFKSGAGAANRYRDLCVFFHWQDATHFCYVHFGAISDDVHNIIGLVNGADRVKINAEPPGASIARLTGGGWHRFRVTYDATTRQVEAFLDDMKSPILTARDTTLGHGLVGVGSFDDTGWFDDLTLWGDRFEQR
jgi:hypothetical protein